MSEPTFRTHTVTWAPSAIKEAIEHAAEALKASDGTFTKVSSYYLSALIDATTALIEHNDREDAPPAADDDEIEQMARELHEWRTGARRRTWPTVKAAADGITYAAYLARAQGTEGGEEHDRLLRESSQRMKVLYDAAQTLLAEREVLAWLHAEAVWQRNAVAASLGLPAGTSPDWVNRWAANTMRIIQIQKADRDALCARLAAVQALVGDFRQRAEQTIATFGEEGQHDDECDSPAECHASVQHFTRKLSARALEKALTNESSISPPAPVSESVPATPELVGDRLSVVAHPELDFPDCLTDFARGQVSAYERAIEECEDWAQDLDRAYAAPYLDVARWLEGRVGWFRERAAQVQSGVDLPEVEAAQETEQ